MSWQDIPGWFDWQDIYDRRAAEAPQGAAIVEVGVFLGRSLAYLLERLRHNPTAKVYAVDPWIDDWRPEEWKDGLHYTWGGDLKAASDAKGPPFLSAMWHLANLCPDGERARVLRVPSVQAARLFDDGSVDQVWIDGDHNYDAVRADIAAWTPKVKPGGVIGGHDHTGSYPGVVQAVREAFGEGHHVSASSWEVRR